MSGRGYALVSLLWFAVAAANAAMSRDVPSAIVALLGGLVVGFSAGLAIATVVPCASCIARAFPVGGKP